MTTMTLTEQYGLPPAPRLFGPPAAPAPVPAPAEMPFSLPPGARLYGFQAEGVRFLVEREAALLGDEMGLGKSIQALIAARLLFHRSAVQRALILCPKSVLFDWWGKCRVWAPELRVVLMYGPRRRRLYDWNAPAHLFIAAYETWREDCDQVPAARFDLVVLDEIQRIKNPNTLLARSVAAIEARIRWGLSGTPMENRLEELVAVFGFLQPGLVDRAAEPARVRSAVQPYVLRREKQQVLTYLPPKERREVWLELSPSQRALYDKLENEGLRAVRGMNNGAAAASLLALIHQLKQVCNLAPDGCSCKLDYIVQQLAAITARGEKALIFSQYPEKTLKPALPRLMPYAPVLFDGRLSDGRRDWLVHCFQEEELPRVLAMSLKVGGVGLTLTRANHVFHLDHWWNPASMEQAEDRTHRIGQQRPVYVTALLTRGTVEERIAEMLVSKRVLFHQVMGELATGARRRLPVGERELFALFGLRY